MALTEYNDKRNFRKTPEPEGSPDRGGQNRFVVQRHAARRLHYDLRLEMDGVLKSWAVPKGPSLNPADKRLAIQTEDHPVRYLTFEGVIPKGNYGAGHMHIWDQGTYQIDKKGKGISSGDLKITFYGAYLKGTFALVRTQRGNEWLLIKKQDGYASPLLYDPESLLPAELQNNDPKKMAPGKFIKPMLAGTALKVFNDPGWIYELKWDGYRALAHIEDHKVVLYSRNGLGFNAKFSRIVKDLEHIAHSVILDGEIVILNEYGLPQFGKLQNYSGGSREVLRYYVFDMLYLNGHSMTELTLVERKSLIPEVLENLRMTLYCDHLEALGTALYQKALEAGMEGIVAKKSNSPYIPGDRTENWLKIKSVKTLDPFICGYTDSLAKGPAFGSLILGMENEGELNYVGNCGTGLTSKIKKELLPLMKPHFRDKSPFDTKLPLRGRTPQWMEPRLVCEVSFNDWTKNGLLRNPVYKGMRMDIIPVEQPVTTQHDIKETALPSGNRDSLEIDGIQVRFTNLDKIYWPGEGLRKYDLIDYYIKVVDNLLPYLKDRPLSLHRHPNGISSPGFYQKDGSDLPEWLPTVPFFSKSADRIINYPICDNKATLLYLANLGSIEFNPWNSTKDIPDQPDYTVIDLDPSPSNSFDDVIETALTTHRILEGLGVEAFCKTSGSKGLHIYIPLQSGYTYEEARDYTKLLCILVMDALPKLTTMERRLNKRGGKIYLDYLQNRQGQTLAAAYCIRPLPEAPVSTPLKWEEVRKGIQIRDYTIHTVPGRISKFGDPFTGILEVGNDISQTLKALETRDA